MGAFLYFLFSTGAVVVALAVSALWLGRRPGSKAARRFLLTAAIVYLLASTYVFPAAVARLWTAGYDRFVPEDIPNPGAVAVVMLGTGGDTVIGWDDRLPLMRAEQAARILEARRVFRTTAATWIVSSGGSPKLPRTEMPGETMRDELVRLGVPRERILVETESLDTHQEAVTIAPMLRSLGVEHLVLVTSAVHMRRSVGAFRAQGWFAIPAVAPDPGLGGTWSEWLVPSRGSLLLSSGLAHELVGLPYYWMRGWWRP